MKTLSQRAMTMPSSPIRKLVPFADLARAAGKKVYHLNIGQPDIHTPDTFFQPIKNMDMPVVEYGPSAGLMSLREKFAAYYRKNRIDVTAEDILITTGGSEAIIFTLMVLMDAGDEVIIPEPFYTNYNGFAVQAGVKVVPIASRIEDGFQLPPIASIREKITPHTRAIMICNPNNPTGYVYSRAEMEALRDICLEKDLFLLTDEVYREFVYDGAEHVSAMHFPEIADRVVMIDSVSKRYSACGARIGMIVSKNRAFMDAALKFGMARLCPPTIEQIASEAAVDTPDSYFEEVNREYKLRRDTMVSLLRAMPGVVCPNPRGAFYLVVGLPVKDAGHFAQWLLTDFDVDGETVMVAPADGFYATPGLGQNEVRIAYVLNTEDIRKAMHIIAEALKVYPGRTN
ncbi:MAG: pyridoxal phosphate-dependent aminotransferase [Calditrichaeota bacterium]|nr:MAG: pyridoxal phosphate-dependent aminotransferase [Calditrichota bacterium]